MKTKVGILMFLIASVMVPVFNVFAEMSITFPYDAGRSEIEIVGERIDPHTRARHIEVTVTGVSSRYEVFQRLDTELVSGGVPLGAGAVKCEATLKSAGVGVVRNERSPVALTTSDQLIYTSPAVPDPSQAARFEIVYFLDTSLVQNPGVFSNSAVIFTFRPYDGAPEFPQVNLSVKVDREDLSFAVETSSGNPNSVNLSSDELDREGYLRLLVPGSFGQGYEVWQVVEQPVMSADGLEPLNNITWSAAVEEGRGSCVGGPFAVGDIAMSEKKIFSCDDGSDSEIVVRYALDGDASVLPAGRYAGLLRYDVRRGGRTAYDVRIRLTAEVKPVFDIKIIDGGNTLNFAAIKAGSGETVERELEVAVISNMRKPYYVVQRLDKGLITEKGDELPLNGFTLQEFIEETVPGRIEYDKPSAVQRGETTIYSSDPDGSPARFKVLYKLTAGDNQPGGNYLADLSYSLMEK